MYEIRPAGQTRSLAGIRLLVPLSKGNPSRSTQASPKVGFVAAPPVRVTQELSHAAARRIVSQAGGDLDAAARRLLASAPQHGIDFSLAFATVEPAALDAPVLTSHHGLLDGPRKGGQRLTPKQLRYAQVRQACLPVLGAGGTAMLFLSEPSASESNPELAAAERAACLVACCEHLSTLPNRRVKIAQALPELDEHWFDEALRLAGFISVGTLSYMRQEPLVLMRGKRPAAPELPAGVTVRWLSDPSQSQGDADLLAALDASYEKTLDCPELCGLRDTADILASHKSTGTLDPSLWMLVTLEGVPAGCVLLSRCPEQRAIELVYLGLGQALRGKGLSKLLLTHAIAKARAQTPGWSVTCAVDERNVPALRLYTGMGFSVFGRRRALVRPV